MEVCETCGVPLLVSREHRWEANGVISLTRSPRNRMVFFESESIDGLFQGIEELIGVPIGHIVIESRSRETRRYIERSFPPEVREVMQSALQSKEKGPADRVEAITPEDRERLMAIMKSITLNIIDISRAYGYGDQRPSELWESGDEHPWRTQLIRNPYSLLFIAADNVGSVEAFEGSDMQGKWEEVGENDYRISVFPGKHPIELKERLKRRRYDFKTGDIQYERCAACGIPLEVARRRWNLKEGTIIDPDTGRRMALFGPFAVDSIFEDLESELGEAIPEAVVEAQRRYIKSAWGGEKWRRSMADFRYMIALRGLGNLVRFEGDREGLGLTIQNSCLHLPMIGTIQALVELAYRAERSTYRWEISDDGDLNVHIRVKI
jgi:hypothetical protein